MPDASDEIDDQFPERNFGWVDHPGRHVVARATRKFAQAAPRLMKAVGAEQDVYLYKAWKDVLGKYPSYPAQQIGDCTSFGSGHATDLLECVQIALDHAPEEFKETCTEAIYGIGREFANMLGSGDGCYGGAVARAVTEVGIVPRAAVGAYSGQRAKQWGGRSGVPKEVKDLCAAHKMKAKALVTTPDEAVAALSNGYPFILCSNWGFDTPRDATGLCRPRGTWAHCMSCGGLRYRDGKRQFLIMQSWGPDQPQGPLVDDMPPFTFWIDEQPMASILAQEDSYAFSKFNGYPGQPLPASWTYAHYL